MLHIFTMFLVHFVVPHLKEEDRIIRKEIKILRENLDKPNIQAVRLQFKCLFSSPFCGINFHSLEQIQIKKKSDGVRCF